MYSFNPPSDRPSRMIPPQAPHTRTPPTSVQRHYCQQAQEIVDWESWDAPTAVWETYYCSTPGCLEMRRDKTR